MDILSLMQKSANTNPRLLLAFLLVYLGNQLEKNSNAHIFQKYGITSSQYNILSALYHAPKPLSPSYFARSLVTSAANFSGILRRMEANSLITRRIDAQDKRGFLLSLTTEGKALIEKIEKVVHEHASNRFKDFSQKDLKLINTSLLKIAILFS